VLVFFLFLTLVFFLIQAQPGDVTNQYILNPNITAEARQELRMQFGVDRPVWDQYVIYLGNFFQGDFGLSFTQGSRPVVDIIAERLPRTLMLFLTAAAISFYLGFAVGKFIAWRRSGFTEFVSTIGGVYLFTIFTPWLALMAHHLAYGVAGGGFNGDIVRRDYAVDAQQHVGDIARGLCDGGARQRVATECNSRQVCFAQRHFAGRNFVGFELGVCD